jgi:hypothetical protein
MRATGSCAFTTCGTPGVDVDEHLHTDGIVNVLEERLDQPPAWHVVLAIAGLALSLLGAVLVASASEEAEPVEAPAPPPTALGRPETA